MKAMVVRQPGGLDAMRLESIPEPFAGPKDAVPSPKYTASASL